MKALELKKLIKEEIQSILTENKTEEKTVDEVGKFFVVKKPKSGMNKNEMVYEATVFHPIEEKDTVGIYKNKSEANRIATLKLKEYEDSLKEIHSQMDEFRKAKKDIDDKKAKTRDLIQKLK